MCRHPVLASEGADSCLGPGVAASGLLAEAIQRCGDGAIRQLGGPVPGSSRRPSRPCTSGVVPFGCGGRRGGCDHHPASGAAIRCAPRPASRRSPRGRRARCVSASVLSHRDGSRPSRDRRRAPAGDHAPRTTAPPGGHLQCWRPVLPGAAPPRAVRSIGVRARRQRGGSPGRRRHTGDEPGPPRTAPGSAPVTRGGACRRAPGRASLSP